MYTFTNRTQKNNYLRFKQYRFLHKHSTESKFQSKSKITQANIVQISNTDPKHIKHSTLNTRQTPHSDPNRTLLPDRPKALLRSVERFEHIFAAILHHWRTKHTIIHVYEDEHVSAR